MKKSVFSFTHSFNWTPDISVYEARTGATEPFLFLNFNVKLPMDKYFVKFRHSSPIYAHYDCCEACTPFIYTRISGRFRYNFLFIYSFTPWNTDGFIGCSKYSARTSSRDTETTYSLNDSRNQTGNILFSQNIVVNHDGSPTFSAKIIFSEVENLRGNRYEIGMHIRLHAFLLFGML